MRKVSDESLTCSTCREHGNSFASIFAKFLNRSVGDNSNRNQDIPKLQSEVGRLEFLEIEVLNCRIKQRDHCGTSPILL